MSKERTDDPQMAGLQTGDVSLQIGSRVNVGLRLEMTPAGILSVAALVSGILISTAVLVGVANRERRM